MSWEDVLTKLGTPLAAPPIPPEQPWPVFSRFQKYDPGTNQFVPRYPGYGAAGTPWENKRELARRLRAMMEQELGYSKGIPFYPGANTQPYPDVLAEYARQIARLETSADIDEAGNRQINELYQRGMLRGGPAYRRIKEIRDIARLPFNMLSL